MSSDPAQYVLIWTEPNSHRLRTYVDPTDPRRPVSAPLHAFEPPVPHDSVINDHDSLRAFIQGTTPDRPLAVKAEVIAQLMGWDPVPAHL